MTIGEIDLSDDLALDLAKWLQDEKVQEFQKNVEERIIRFLFSHDQEDPHFFQAVQMLAWTGSQCNARALLQKEIIDLNRSKDDEIIPCGFGKSLKKTSHKICLFIAKHKTEILLGAVLCATGIGIAAVTGYTCSVAAGGVVIAGTGSIFAKEEESKKCIPQAPPPPAKEVITLINQSPFPGLPKLDLPSSTTEFLVTADGIWANNQFYSNQDLARCSAASFNESGFSKESPDYPTAFSKTVPYKDIAIQSAPEVYYEILESHRVDRVPSNESPPRTSKTFVIEGKQERHCYIGWINGINNTFEESKTSGAYLQSLARGHAVCGIYNCTHGLVLEFWKLLF